MRLIACIAALFIAAPAAAVADWQEYSYPDFSFTVHFPAVAEEEATDEGQARDADLPRGTETVLLVEDEDAVRRLAEHLLGQLGYRVLAAPDGTNALRLAKEQHGRIDLLLTDVVMPGMSGRQVAEHIQDLHPETKVLYLSGYTDDAVVRHGVQEAETAFLQKPFTTATLATKVRAVLDDKS